MSLSDLTMTYIISAKNQKLCRGTPIEILAQHSTSEQIMGSSHAKIDTNLEYNNIVIKTINTAMTPGVPVSSRTTVLLG